MPSSTPEPKEIRDQFTEDLSAWDDIRKESKKDMLCVLGKVWEAMDPDGLKERNDASRPCLSLDEINQYLNQAVNAVRQNKPGIRVEPAGNQATDKTAEFREDMVRGIEYRSKAQQAYTTAFEGAIQRSYGYFAIGRRYEKEEGFDQELHIRRIPNPDTVVIDPNYKDAVAADMEHGFITDRIGKKAFRRKYGEKVKTVDFSAEQEVESSGWIGEEQIQIGEYWYFRTSPTTLYLLEDGSEAGLTVKGSDFDKKPHIASGELFFPDGKGFKILKSRSIDNKSAWQAFTNGLEILDEVEFGGPWIPIIPVFGKELFVDEGSGAKRRLISMVRLARSPVMLYCYMRTTEAEIVGMMPKVPWVGYEGQFEDHEDEWKMANKLPIPFLQAKPIMDATGQAVLPLPQRVSLALDLQSVELGAEAARRAIQAAMGINPLPTAAQRQTEKSGVALRRIEQSEQIGSFHFVDNLHYGLEQTGRILNWQFKPTYDTAGRQVGTRKADGSHEVITLNQPYTDGDGQQRHNPTDVGEHDVTISTGPSYQSLREEAAEFASLIVQNIEQLPIQPAVKAKFFALIIRMKNLGPLGDAMVELLDPGDESPQAIGAKLQQTVQELQAMHAYAQEVEKERDQLKFDKAAKTVESETRLQLAAFQEEIKVLIAEIQTKAQKESERDALFADAVKQLAQMSHDRGMQAEQHAHEVGQAEQARQAAQDQAEPNQPQAAQQQ